MNPYIKTTIMRLGFYCFSPCRPYRIGLWNVLQRKLRSLLVEQRSEEEPWRSCTTNCKSFCCVLLLFVEVCRHLLPPLEMFICCSKDTLEFAKGVSSAAQTLNFGWMRYLSKKSSIWPRIQVIYSANPSHMETLEAGPLLEEIHLPRTHPRRG